jgi:hypothetical protein
MLVCKFRLNNLPMSALSVGAANYKTKPRKRTGGSRSTPTI